MDTFDYVIVGAGSAGSVLTNRLSEDAGTSICVLEAGPRDWHPYIHLPAGFIKTFHMKSINWAYQQEPGPWTGGRSIYAPRGKTLGGSSSINGHIYNRGQRQDFDTWAQLGNRGWGYPDVLPYFKRLERRVGEGEDAFRGRDGNLTGRIRSARRSWPARSVSAFPETPITTARSRRAYPTPSARFEMACASVRQPPSCIQR
jgi:choline dehydrogenase